MPSNLRHRGFSQPATWWYGGARENNYAPGRFSQPATWYGGARENNYAPGRFSRRGT